MYLLSGHTSRVLSVAFSGDGSKVVSGSNDKTVKIWNADNGEVIQTLSGDVDMTHVYECIIIFITVYYLYLNTTWIAYNIYSIDFYDSYIHVYKCIYMYITICIHVTCYILNNTHNIYFKYIT